MIGKAPRLGMYRIVAGVDDSEERARALAETIIDTPMDRSEVEVVLIHHFEENPSGASVAQVSSVQEAADRLEAADITVRFDESSGNNPAQTILDFVKEYDADLVAVTGRKRSPTGKILFGSTSQEVILSTDRPVLICSPGSAN